MELEVIQGDITTIVADAIVNAANSSLLGGGGVDGAIHRKGGSAILEECMQIRARQGGCKVGEAVFTTAGDLPAKYVIHTVGPVWKGGHHDESKLLHNCYTHSLNIAIELNIKTIAFPNISTGVYRFPKPIAADTAFNTVRFHPKLHLLERVIFVCFDEDNYQLYLEKLSEL